MREAHGAVDPSIPDALPAQLVDHRHVSLPFHPKPRHHLEPQLLRRSHRFRGQVKVHLAQPAERVDLLERKRSNPDSFDVDVRGRVWRKDIEPAAQARGSLGRTRPQDEPLLSSRSCEPATRRRLLQGGEGPPSKREVNGGGEPSGSAGSGRSSPALLRR